VKANHYTTTEQTILYQHDLLTLCVSAVADKNAVALLKHTIYGTEGIRYYQTGQETKINDLHNPYFFHLYQQQELIGLYCLDQRPVGFQEESFSGYYGRYLAVRDDVKGNGYGQLLKSTAIKYVSQKASAPYLFYSYIEAKNTRSMAVSIREKFESVAKLRTFMFRRFSPRKDARFRIASSNDSDKVLSLTRNQYVNYGFQNFLNIKYNNHYFMLEENGRVLAGVQANPIIWKLVHVPGKLGPFIRHIAPLIPGLRRFFNPEKQSFLALEGVYIAEGQTKLLPVLLESVLAHFKIHTAMWQIDHKDPLNEVLDSIHMGHLSQFQPGVTTHVMVKAVGLPSTVNLNRTPVYVSSFDFS
jgi:GNAT superfamily N-acetyltransferase